MTAVRTEGWVKPEGIRKEHYKRDGDEFSACGMVPFTGNEPCYPDPPEDPWSYCRTCRSRL